VLRNALLGDVTILLSQYDLIRRNFYKGITLTFLNKQHLFFLFLTLVLTYLFYHFLDQSITLYFHELNNNYHTLHEILIQITRLGNSAWYLIPSILLFIYFKKFTIQPYEATMALYLFVTNLAAGLLVWLFKVPFGRARPVEYLEEGIYGFQWFKIEPSYVSFPSGHSITIISTVVAFSLLFPKWRYLLLPLGALIAFSRVALTEHYMSDVIFASFLGTMVALFLHAYYFKTKES